MSLNFACFTGAQRGRVRNRRRILKDTAAAENVVKDGYGTTVSFTCLVSAELPPTNTVNVPGSTTRLISRS